MELADRLKHAPGSDGSLEYTHNLTQGDAPAATNALLPGQKRPALHPRNTARRAPKAWAPDADFDLRTEMETGYVIGPNRGERDYTASYSGKAVMYDASSVESAVRRVAQLQEKNSGLLERLPHPRARRRRPHRAPEDQAVLPCPSLVGVTVDSTAPPRHPRI